MRADDVGRSTKRRVAFGVTAILAVTVITAACGGDDGDEIDSTSTPASISTTVASNTVAPGTPPQARGYRAAAAFPHLDFQRMVALKWFPENDDDAIAMTQSGVIYRANLGSDDAPSVFLDVSELLIDNAGNEEGLLGFAFAPDYGTSGAFYIYYTAGGPRRSVIARYNVSGDAADPASAQIIMEVPQPYANHNGGALEFGPDGYLYISLGDGGSAGDPQGNGQSTSTMLGKILRIDVSGASGYTSPADNPFASSGGLPEVWAFGLRNPWRITFDRETDDLWAGDVGQGQWEEVNRIIKGANYGWNVVEGFECFHADECDNEGMQAPRAVYGHDEGCSVTGGYVYRGASMPELDGWYIYGDYCSGFVWAVDTEDETSDPVLLMESGSAISSFAEDPDGEVYLVTFNRAIYRIERK